MVAAQRPKNAWHQPMQGPLVWQSSWRQAADHDVSPALRAPWRVALLSDGSIMRHLDSMTDGLVEKDCMDTVDLGVSTAGLPESVATVPGPRSQREVHLHVSGKMLVYATGWWNPEHIPHNILENDAPDWTSLLSRRMELHLEITQVFCGDSPSLERKFGYEGPFWGREYTLWHKSNAVALVQEVFSPAMEEYLGPTFTWARSVKARGLDSLGLVASTE